MPVMSMGPTLLDHWDHWRHSRWRDCTDLPGGIPPYLRCLRCYRLVTTGERRQGGCVCKNRKFNPALSLTLGEIVLLKLGWFPLDNREVATIRPMFPWLTRFRPRLLGAHR